MMKFISLFAGIGGFDLGFERAGMMGIAQVEKDKRASTVLQRHFAHVERFEDVTHVGHRNLPAANVICGGFPCQDVSVAGRRAGLAGERSGLWHEFHRVLGELKPQFTIIENVPGLLSSKGGRDFATILSGLEELGYFVAWRILDAQYFGVAQRRRRLFIVASFGDGRAAEILFERESSSGHFETSSDAGEGVASPLKASAPSRRNGGSSPTAGEFVVGTLAASGSGTARTGNARSEADMLVNTFDYKIAKDLVVEAIDVRSLRSNGDISGTLQSKASGGYSLNYQNPIAFNHNAGAGAGLAIAELSSTLKTGHNSAPAVLQQHTGVRRLTPRECERLQGFPDDWTAGQSDAARYKQLGNAVCVNVAEWLGHRLMAVGR